MATPYYPYCPEGEQPFYFCDPCQGVEKARVRSVGAVTDNYYATLMADPTDQVLWQEGIANEQIIIIPRVNGTLDVPDPDTNDGYGDDAEGVLDTLFTLSWRDPNYRQNCVFYNELKKKNGVYHAIYRTGSVTHITPETVTFRSGAPITANIQDNVEWVGSARWRSNEQPCPFDTPVGIFECFGLLEV